MTEKLKQKDLPSFRENLLTVQEELCILCELPIMQKEAALDHCHATGYCRSVLHRDCNVLLGKIENYLKRYGKRLRENETALANFFRNCFGYMKDDYKEMPFHPKHRTPFDKELKKLRRRLKLAKKPETKTKLKAMIKEFKEVDTG